MKKRKLTITIQVAGTKMVKRENGCISERVGAIETHYEFYNVNQFLDWFPPKHPSTNLINAIKNAFENGESVTFNRGNGNEIFCFRIPNN